MGVKLVTQYEEANKDIGAFVADKVICDAVDEVLSAPTPDMPKPIQQVIKTTNTIIESMIGKNQKQLQ